MYNLCPDFQFRVCHYGLLEDSPGRSQVLTERNSRSHYEEKGTQMRSGGARLACPWSVHRHAERTQGRLAGLGSAILEPWVLISQSIICLAQTKQVLGLLQRSFIILLLFFITG